MRKLFLAILVFGGTGPLSNGQYIDFHRIHNLMIPQIAPQVGRNTLGILFQDSRWSEVAARQSSDIILYFKDKKQFLSVVYGMAYSKNQNLKFTYSKNLGTIGIWGLEIGHQRQTFQNDLPIKYLKASIHGWVRWTPNNQIFIKYERIENAPFHKWKNGFMFGSVNQLNKYLSLEFFYLSQIEGSPKGLRGNIKGTYHLFSGEIGWEPIPFSLFGSMTYNLPKCCNFGITLRNHQYLGLLTTVFLQKQWDFKSK
jgi:hypothetical protein